MRYERLDYKEVDWRELDRYPDRTVFQTKAWLDFLRETQNADPIVAAIKNDRDIVGYFTGLIIRVGVRKIVDR